MSERLPVRDLAAVAQTLKNRNAKAVDIADLVGMVKARCRYRKSLKAAPVEHDKKIGFRT